jgi:[NiFe] hydrogenase assembly HybE family chaperone
MDEPRAIAERLEAAFRHIERERMAGVPILNRALRVRAVATQGWNGQWLCVLVTPWFINVMLLPQEGAPERLPVGAKRTLTFPAGRFEFIRGEEEDLGPYWMCSLFSPVLEFADAESAEAAAATALEVMLAPDEEETADEAQMAMIWRGERPKEAEAGDDAQAGTASDGEENLSRRAFLTGKQATGERP